MVNLGVKKRKKRKNIISKDKFLDGSKEKINFYRGRFLLIEKMSIVMSSYVYNNIYVTILVPILLNREFCKLVNRVQHAFRHDPKFSISCTNYYVLSQVIINYYLGNHYSRKLITMRRPAKYRLSRFV